MVQHIITGNGGIAHSTDQAKIGASSIEFVNVWPTGVQYLSAPAHKNWFFSVCPFTIECFFYLNDPNRNNIFISSHTQDTTTGAAKGWSLETFQLNKITFFWDNGGGTSYTTTETISQNVWHHLAVVVKVPSGPNPVPLMGIFIDGVLSVIGWKHIGSGRDAGLPLFIGGWSDEQGWFWGFQDEVRISNKARYLTDFTPTTTHFTNDDSTILLLQSDTTDGNTTFTDSSDALNPNTCFTMAPRYIEDDTERRIRMSKIKKNNEIYYFNDPEPQISALSGLKDWRRKRDSEDGWSETKESKIGG